MPPPPGSSSHQSRGNPSASPSPTDPNDNPPSSSRLSKDSEGYPSWLPKRPPPPAPASTFQSSIIGGLQGPTPSPVEPTPFIGGRKPTPRSVRIVNMQSTFGGAVDKEVRTGREATDHTHVGVDAPPKVWTRASAIPPTAFNPSAQDEMLPLPQPRFRAKNLHLQLLDHPSKWMKLYFYIWPLLVLYHIPLQTFFDFNAVFILLEVAKFPNPQSTGRNWALGAAAYIAAWLVWIFVVCLMYEIVYSFTRRWRLRRPLMLPIYLSSSAFNYAAMTSYTNFSFLQYLRLSAFTSEHTSAEDVQSSSGPVSDLDEFRDENQGSWRQGTAETCFFYSQNLSTVALLLPRAGLSLALLFSFSSAAQVPAFSTSTSFTRRDGTYFRSDGSLTDYSRGVLIANATWTAWRILVLLVSWLGLWVFSNQRLGGLCGPRHRWDEAEQEKTRSVYSEAASEYGAYRGSFYQPGGANEYGGDELPWEWREATRVRVQDAFEFCITTRRRSADGAAGLRWSGVPVPGYGYGLRHRRTRSRQKRWSAATAKARDAPLEKAPGAEAYEGLERVFAAVGLAGLPSPSRRKGISEDLFDAPADAPKHPTIAPLRFEERQPVASTSMLTGLEAPRMVKRNSKDKIPGSVGAGAPLLSLPYPFSRPGAGHVSSKDSVPFPGGSGEQRRSKASSKSKSTKSTSSPGTGTEESASGSGPTGEEEEDEEEEEIDDDEEELDDEDEDEDEDEEDEEDGFIDSEEPSSGRASGSMSSLGQPISPSRGHPFGARRPFGAGHGRNMSGVSSALSSGQGMSGGSHVHSQSVSSSHGTRSAAGVSVLSQSTGNPESTDSELLPGGRARASLSQSSSPAAPARPLVGASIPMPPRHPHLQGQGRGRSATAPTGNIPSAAYTLSTLSTQTAPIAFPTVSPRHRVESGRGIVVDPAVLYADSGMSSDGDMPPADYGDEDGEPNGDEDEQHDRVGLLGVPSSPSPRASLLGASRVSLTTSSSGDGARSRTHSATRSRHSSTNARSRSRTHSAASARDRANSLGASMRSLVHSAAASLSQLELVMRGATGPAAGLGGLGIGSRPRSRVNSSMARLEEDVELPAAAATTEMTTRNRDVSGASTSSGSASQNGSVEVAPNRLLERARREEVEAEGYSSGGTHSRSGSENLSAENYTFGRPIAFMQHPPVAHHESRLDEEEEIALENRSASDDDEARGSPVRTMPMAIPIVARSAEQSQSHAQQIPESYTSASFYSLNPSDLTATPPTPVPIHFHTEGRDQSQSPPQSTDHSPERQGIAIPWNNSSLPTSPANRWIHPRPGGQTIDSESPPDISTAAGSFVTAPATIEGATTTTESSGGRTISGSWETSPHARPSAVRSGGMVERPGDDMGLDAGAWRVV